jgi:hypothetical protein
MSHCGGRRQSRDSWTVLLQNVTVFFAWTLLTVGFPLVRAGVRSAGYGCD